MNLRTTNWTAGPCPNLGWAERVHPELEPEAALDKLWEEITYVLRLDTDDPVEAWRERMKVIVASADRMTDRRFDSLHHAQQVLDACVADYNLRRPHQAIAMLVPASRFQPDAAVPFPTIQPSQPATVSSTEITRRVSASGLIGVSYQQVSAGRHLAGQVVTVRLHPTVLQVFFAGQLIRTVPRRSTKEVVQLRAHRPHQPKRRPKSN